MKFKMGFALVALILAVLILSENQHAINVEILWTHFLLPAWLLMFLSTTAGFILAFIIRPSRRQRVPDQDYLHDDNYKTNSNTLSQEDKDYIN